jgi:LysM repeat protein
MRRAVRALVAAVIVMLPFIALHRWESDRAATRPQEIVATIGGQAQVMRLDGSNWEAVSEANLYVGDAVRALDSVRLLLNEGSVIDMAPGAVVLVQSARLEDGAVSLALQAGSLGVGTNNPRLRIQSPSLILTVERARFRVDIRSSGDEYVMADQGLVYTESGGETVTVAAGETMRTGVGQRAKMQQSTPVVIPPPPSPPPRTATPTVTPVPPTVPPVRVHVIEKGDTLYDLAIKYDITIEDLINANNFDNPNVLSIGQKLIIPQSKQSK